MSLTIQTGKIIRFMFILGDMFYFVLPINYIRSCLEVNLYATQKLKHQPLAKYRAEYM